MTDMTTSGDLHLAFLSPDAYSQGYGRGLEHGESQIGQSSLRGAASGMPTDVATAQAWQNAGSFAAVDLRFHDPVMRCGRGAAIFLDTDERPAP